MKKLNRTQLACIAGVAILLSGILSLVNFPGKQYVGPLLDEATSALLEQSGYTKTSGVPIPPSVGRYAVQKIVDGDTIDVRVNERIERIRLIGIDAPESVAPEQPIECYGPEASIRARTLLEGMQVRLEADPTQDDKDSYGRLLRYIYLENGTLVNERLIEEGYAEEYTFAAPYRHQAAFKAAEARAQESDLGLWGAACSRR